MKIAHADKLLTNLQRSGVLYAETRVSIIMKIGHADKLQPFIRSRKLLQLHTLVLNFTLKS